MINILNKFFSKKEQEDEINFSKQDIQNAENYLAELKEKLRKKEQEEEREKRKAIKAAEKAELDAQRAIEGQGIISDNSIFVCCNSNDLPQIINKNMYQFDLNTIKHEIENNSYLMLYLDTGKIIPHKEPDSNARIKESNLIYIDNEYGEIHFTLNGGNVHFSKGTAIGMKDGFMFAYSKEDSKSNKLTSSYDNNPKRCVKNSKYQLDAENLPILNLGGVETIPLEKHKDLLSNLKSGETLEIGRIPKTEKNIKTSDCKYISRSHVMIEKKGDKLYMTDISSNGTFVFENTKANPISTNHQNVETNLVTQINCNNHYSR